MPSNSNNKSSCKAKTLPQFSIYSGNKPLLDLLEIQRKSFFGLLENGIAHELAQTGIFKETAKTPSFIRNLELIFKPESYKLVSPNCTPKQAILNGKTYACKLYVQATLTIQSSPREFEREKNSTSLRSTTTKLQSLAPQQKKTSAYPAKQVSYTPKGGLAKLRRGVRQVSKINAAMPEKNIFHWRDKQGVLPKKQKKLQFLNISSVKPEVDYLYPKWVSPALPTCLASHLRKSRMSWQDLSGVKAWQYGIPLRGLLTSSPAQQAKVASHTPLPALASEGGWQAPPKGRLLLPSLASFPRLRTRSANQHTPYEGKELPWYGAFHPPSEAKAERGYSWAVLQACRPFRYWTKSTNPVGAINRNQEVSNNVNNLWGWCQTDLNKNKTKTQLLPSSKSNSNINTSFFASINFTRRNTILRSTPSRYSRLGILWKLWNLKTRFSKNTASVDEILLLDKTFGGLKELHTMGLLLPSLASQRPSRLGELYLVKAYRVETETTTLKINSKKNQSVDGSSLLKVASEEVNTQSKSFTSNKSTESRLYKPANPNLTSTSIEYDTNSLYTFLGVLLNGYQLRKPFGLAGACLFRKADLPSPPKELAYFFLRLPPSYPPSGGFGCKQQKEACEAGPVCGAPALLTSYPLRGYSWQAGGMLRSRNSTNGLNNSITDQPYYLRKIGNLINPLLKSATSVKKLMEVSRQYCSARTPMELADSLLLPADQTGSSTKKKNIHKELPGKSRSNSSKNHRTALHPVHPTDGKDVHETVKIFHPWIFLGELPLMTKRGDFILNGSPRVIVNQIARCPGIYFQEKRRGVGFEQEIRVSADLIPQRGPWLRIQSDWEGRFWARLKQEGRVKYATLYEAFQEGEKQYIAPVDNLVNTSSSLFPKSEILTFQERTTKEDRQKKALIRLFKNSARYSLGKLGRFRINQRVHFAAEQAKEEHLPNFFYESSLLGQKLRSSRPSQIYSKIAKVSLDSEAKQAARGKKNKYASAILPNTRFSNLLQIDEWLRRYGFAWTALHPVHPTDGKDVKDVQQAIPLTSNGAWLLLPSEQAAVREGMACLLLPSDQVAQPTFASESGEGGKHLPYPPKGDKKELGYFFLRNKQQKGAWEAGPVCGAHSLKENNLGSRQLDWCSLLPWNEKFVLQVTQYRTDDCRLNGTNSINSIKQLFSEGSASLVRREEVDKQPLMKNSSVIEINSSSVDRLDLSKSANNSINHINKSHLLMAEDINAVHTCLEELLEGRGFTDDIDHFKNRFIRTSGKLLQQQFELGLHRLNEVMTPLLKNLIQNQVFSGPSTPASHEAGKLPMRIKDASQASQNEVVNKGLLSKFSTLSEVGSPLTLLLSDDQPCQPRATFACCAGLVFGKAGSPKIILEINSKKTPLRLAGKSIALSQNLIEAAPQLHRTARPSLRACQLRLPATFGTFRSEGEQGWAGSQQVPIGAWEADVPGNKLEFSETIGFNKSKCVDSINFILRRGLIMLKSSNSASQASYQLRKPPRGVCWPFAKGQYCKPTSIFSKIPTTLKVFNVLKTVPIMPIGEHNRKPKQMWQSGVKLMLQFTERKKSVNQTVLQTQKTEHTSVGGLPTSEGWLLTPRVRCLPRVASEGRSSPTNVTCAVLPKIYKFLNDQLGFPSDSVGRKIKATSSEAAPAKQAPLRGTVGGLRSWTAHSLPLPSAASPQTPNGGKEAKVGGTRRKKQAPPENTLEVSKPLTPKGLAKQLDQAASQIPKGIIKLQTHSRNRKVFTQSQNTDIAAPFRWLRTSKPVNSAFREFFGSNPLSQYMDQTNPLAEITHKRRLSSMGPGGIKRETAGMEVRGIHPTHYGRVCPIETPEGKNAGLVNSPTVYGRIGKDGFMETPLYQVLENQIQLKRWAFFSAQQEEDEKSSLATCDIGLIRFNLLSHVPIPVQTANNPLAHFQQVERNRVGYRALSPIQTISIATALIPFLEHDDANRALMGSNMQRQAIPLLLPERPIVGTGFEPIAIVESGQALQATGVGYVSYVSASKVVIYNTRSIEKSCATPALPSEGGWQAPNGGKEPAVASSLAELGWQAKEKVNTLSSAASEGGKPQSVLRNPLELVGFDKSLIVSTKKKSFSNYQVNNEVEFDLLTTGWISGSKTNAATIKSFGGHTPVAIVFNSRASLVEKKSQKFHTKGLLLAVLNNYNYQLPAKQAPQRGLAKLLGTSQVRGGADSRQSAVNLMLNGSKVPFGRSNPFPCPLRKAAVDTVGISSQLYKRAESQPWFTKVAGKPPRGVSKQPVDTSLPAQLNRSSHLAGTGCAVGITVLPTAMPSWPIENDFCEARFTKGEKNFVYSKVVNAKNVILKILGFSLLPNLGSTASFACFAAVLKPASNPTFNQSFSLGVTSDKISKINEVDDKISGNSISKMYRTFFCTGGNWIGVHFFLRLPASEGWSSIHKVNTCPQPSEAGKRRKQQAEAEVNFNLIIKNSITVPSLATLQPCFPKVADKRQQYVWWNKSNFFSHLQSFQSLNQLFHYQANNEVEIRNTDKIVATAFRSLKKYLTEKSNQHIVPEVLPYCQKFKMGTYVVYGSFLLRRTANIDLLWHVKKSFWISYSIKNMSYSLLTREQSNSLTALHSVHPRDVKDVQQATNKAPKKKSDFLDCQSPSLDTIATFRSEGGLGKAGPSPAQQAKVASPPRGYCFADETVNYEVDLVSNNFGIWSKPNTGIAVMPYPLGDYAHKTCPIQFCSTDIKQNKEILNISKKIPHETRTQPHICSTHNTFILKPFEQNLQIYQRSNQETCLSQRPLVQEGEWVQKGDFVADCSSSDSGDLALGKNVTVAYMPWEGYNFEDAIVISDRLVADDVYTSIHIERYEIKVSKNSQGKERITNQIPSLPLGLLKHLDSSGIARVSTWVQPGDILVGKVVELKRPLSPYERLAWELASRLSPTSPEREKWLNKVWLEDISLRLPPGVCGRIVNSQIVSTEWSEKEQVAHPLEVHIYLAVKRKIQVGDKLAGRHGNKGIVSIILPRQDMPYLGDGNSIDMVLNPLGVPSRMNLGQIFECLLGLAGKQLGCNFKVTPFDEIAGGEASRSLVFLKLYQCRLIYRQQWLFTPTFPGKSKLFDGRTGEPFENWVTVGQAYMLKLVHMVDHKIHARSTGPYSLFTRQPVRGRSRRGGQRLGEMEVWAIEGFGAAYTLQEFLTVKSDDLRARTTLQQGFYKQNDVTLGKIHISPGNPEAFKVLLSELQALCLHIQM